MQLEEIKERCAKTYKTKSAQCVFPMCDYDRNYSPRPLTDFYDNKTSILWKKNCECPICVIWALREWNRLWWKGTKQKAFHDIAMQRYTQFRQRRDCIWKYPQDSLIVMIPLVTQEFRPYSLLSVSKIDFTIAIYLIQEQSVGLTGCVR